MSKYRKWLTKNKGDAIAVIISVALFVFTFFYIVPTFLLPNILFSYHLSTEGFMPIELSLDELATSGKVKMVGNCYELDANVDAAQAESIVNGVNGVVGPRPNIHDLFRDFLKASNSKILMVKITAVKDDMYFSKFIVKQDNTIFEMDARPSDAIAVAARADYNVPLYINETMMKIWGKKIC
jgi:bifunctional DNase/RNase